MIDDLRLNTKLSGFDGVIGRRDFCLNLVYMCMINTLFALPLSGYCMCNISSITDIFTIGHIIIQSPFWLKLWVLPGTLFVLYIGVSNIIRRLNDINGNVNQNVNTAAAVCYVFSAFSLLFPFALSLVFGTINFLLFLFLIFAKGKITGKYPYDFQKEFNWGAFFGTWIWGLFNKSYKTLWMLILWLTPWGFWYSLVCGFKGNEWAAKNRDWGSLEEFQRSQETQTIVFVILTVLIIPIIYFIIIVAIVGIITFSVIDETKNSPDKTSVTIEKFDSAILSLGSIYFESYTITEDENKFYVLPEDWKFSTFSDKKDMLDMAASMSAIEREKSDKKGYYTKTTELKRTKIYNSENRELLGEFFTDENFNIKKAGFKEIVKNAMNSYKFYNPTKM